MVPPIVTAMDMRRWENRMWLHSYELTNITQHDHMAVRIMAPKRTYISDVVSLGGRRDRLPSSPRSWSSPLKVLPRIRVSLSRRSLGQVDRRRTRRLRATMIVEALVRTAPTAMGSMNPIGARAPADSDDSAQVVGGQTMPTDSSAVTGHQTAADGPWAGIDATPVALPGGGHQPRDGTGKHALTSGLLLPRHALLDRHPVDRIQAPTLPSLGGEGSAIGSATAALRRARRAIAGEIEILPQAGHPDVLRRAGVGGHAHRRLPDRGRNEPDRLAVAQVRTSASEARSRSQSAVKPAASARACVSTRRGCRRARGRPWRASRSRLRK
jgi:hypothetical protein